MPEFFFLGVPSLGWWAIDWIDKSGNQWTDYLKTEEEAHRYCRFKLALDSCALVREVNGGEVEEWERQRLREMLFEETGRSPGVTKLKAKPMRTSKQKRKRKALQLD